MSAAQKRRQLERQHRRDPHCRRCTGLTVLRPQQRGGCQEPDTAVMARWYPKDHPRNALPPGKPRRRLTCASCANARAAQFEGERPLEELWAASGRGGFSPAVYFVIEPTA